MNVRKKIAPPLLLLLTAMTLLSVISCSFAPADESVIGKWELIEATPNNIDERVAMFLDIQPDGKAIVEFALPPEYNEYLESVNFDFESLRIEGTCTSGRGENTLRIQMPPAEEGNDEYDGDDEDDEDSGTVPFVVPNIEFFSADGDILYTLEEDILTLTIQFEERTYTEVYRKVN